MAHLPVMLREVLEVYEGKKIDIFFDGTLGAAGHAKAILEGHPEIKRYIGCDRDPSAHEIAKKVLAPWGNVVDFRLGKLTDIIEESEGFDASLIDAGVSSMQLDQKERGFSFRFDAPLDMRMGSSGDLTAAKIVNRYSEKELARIFFEWGEEKKARQVAKAIVAARGKKRIETTFELVKIISKVVKRKRIHPATLVFQALRIAVNEELDQLKRGIELGIEKLSQGGRIAVISFHSLEDRIVKTLFRNEKAHLRILTKKPLVSKDRSNPRSRSAKLRAAEKI